MGGTRDHERSRTGFAPVLRGAIQRRGLSLERLQTRLGDLGVNVSIATLSYWQSGRSEPGRRSSLVAVPALEKILGLDPGELGTQLGHRVARPDGAAHDPVELSEILAGRPTSADLRHEDARLRDQLEVVSEHCSVTVDADLCLTSRWVRRVLVANVAGADRFLVTRAVEEPAAAAVPPAVEPLLHCTSGRTHVDAERDLVAHEVLLDRELDLGDSIIVEYRLSGFAGVRSYESARRRPLRELVLEVRFDQDRLPAEVELVHADLDGAGEVRGPVRPDATGCVRMIRHHLPSGRYAVRWS